MIRAPIVAQYSEAPEEDGEYGPGESGPCVVPDCDQSKIDDYVDGKVPSETVTRSAIIRALLNRASSAANRENPSDDATTPLLRVRLSNKSLSRVWTVEMRYHKELP